MSRGVRDPIKEKEKQFAEDAAMHRRQFLKGLDSGTISDLQAAKVFLSHHYAGLIAQAELDLGRLKAKAVEVNSEVDQAIQRRRARG